MNETSIIRPWQPAPAAKTNARPAAVAKNEADDRLLMARLFGKNPAPIPTANAVRPPTGPDDEFAPHLGRHLDVIA